MSGEVDAFGVVGLGVVDDVAGLGILIDEIEIIGLLLLLDYFLFLFLLFCLLKLFLLSVFGRRDFLFEFFDHLLFLELSLPVFIDFVLLVSFDKLTDDI